MAIVTINNENLANIAEAIRGKNGTTNTYKPSEMAAAIDAIEGGGGTPLTGDLSSLFDVTYLTGTSTAATNSHKKLFNNILPIVTTKDVTNASKMFYKNTYITEVPFEINITDGASLDNVFYETSNLTKCPKINGKIGSTSAAFEDCHFLTDVSALEDVEFNDEYGMQSRVNMFYYCVRLRSIPESFLRKIGHTKNGSYYLRFFYYCCSLGEIVNLGVSGATITSNGFTTALGINYRLRRFTFETNEDGTPKTANWHTQTIDLSNKVGYGNVESYGFTLDTQVYSTESYEALKDNPDVWAGNIDWSLYNHDSIVETINSLPDTSAFLAANSGKTNTIKFNTYAGALTPCGDATALTQEEIAVAAAKGWTVTLV